MTAIARSLFNRFNTRIPMLKRVDILNGILGFEYSIKKKKKHGV